MTKKGHMDYGDDAINVLSGCEIQTISNRGQNFSNLILYQVCNASSFVRALMQYK